MKSLCVFCGSSPGANNTYVNSARSFGTLLAKHGITLVFGGGKVGLMGQMADAVLENGGKAIGVIPEQLVQKEVAHAHLTEMHVVKTMHERKALMYSLADAFAVLPGGSGTMDELFEVFTWTQLGLLAKPIGILNVDGYFDYLRTFLDHCVEQRFVKREHAAMLLVESHGESLLRQLQNSRPVTSDKWIDKA